MAIKRKPKINNVNYTLGPRKLPSAWVIKEQQPGLYIHQDVELDIQLDRLRRLARSYAALHESMNGLLLSLNNTRLEHRNRR